MKSVGFSAIVLCLILPAVAQDRQETVKTTVTEFRIKQLSEDKASPNDRIGTTVLLELLSETEDAPLTGVQIDPSKITFTDSTGKDLFAAGKQARIDYDKKNPVYGGMRSVENALTVNPARSVGRDKVKPGAVYLRCHALTTPARQATSVRIKGEIDIYTVTDEKRTATLTKEQLTSRTGFKVGDYTAKLVSYGGGVAKGRSYRSYEVDSLLMLQTVAVVGKKDGPSPVVLEEQTIRVYEDEIAATDEIQITYLLPEKSTLLLDVEVTPGSVGR